ncbi:MAG: 30S ribosomal protein S8 [bacterium]|nr:30S ribosomal protein S8 [bacterium]
MTDPITDMLNRIKNAQAVQKTSVKVPWSDLKFRIAKILESEGFVGEIKKKGRKTKKFIDIELKYEIKEYEIEKAINPIKETKPMIRGIKRVSKPGQRIYEGAKNIKQIKGGFGISIISTPQGLMTDKEARKRKLGGEVLCQVW